MNTLIGLYLIPKELESTAIFIRIRMTLLMIGLRFLYQFLPCSVGMMNDLNKNKCKTKKKNNNKICSQ